MEDTKPLTVNYRGTPHSSVKVKMSVAQFAQFNNATTEERKIMALDILEARGAKIQNNLSKRRKLNEKRAMAKQRRQAQRFARRNKR